MAKRSTRGRKAADSKGQTRKYVQTKATRAKRKQPFDKVRLKEFASAMDGMAATIRQLIAEMEYHGLSEIAVDGAGKLTEGEQQINLFITKANTALVEAAPSARRVKLPDETAAD